MIFLKKKIFEVWREGHPMGKAHCYGTTEASSFPEACEKLLCQKKYFNRLELKMYSCRLFDNEKDARKSFD